MELLRDNEIRYTLHTTAQGSMLRAYVLRLRQPIGEVRMPRTALRYDIPDTFKTQQEAFSIGLGVAKRIADGELSASKSEIEKKFRDYALHGSAVFQLATEQWEPTLRIVSRKKENKGATQDLSDEQTHLQRNPFPTPERASEYAIEFGERLVLGFVPGLKV